MLVEGSLQKVTSVEANRFLCERVLCVTMKFFSNFYYILFLVT